MDVYNLAAECLPSYAKIKLCRGKGLYAVRLDACDVENSVKNLSNNGFLTTVSGVFLTVTPGRVIIEAQAATPARDDISDHLYRRLSRLSGRDVCQGEIELFTMALKSRLYTPETVENRLRRQAAACMRLGCGGSLHAIRYATIIDKEANI